jgi:hypothetical protein
MFTDAVAAFTAADFTAADFAAAAFTAADFVWISLGGTGIIIDDVLFFDFSRAHRQTQITVDFSAPSFHTGLVRCVECRMLHVWGENDYDDDE